jgi:hypothetical protein
MHEFVPSWFGVELHFSAVLTIAALLTLALLLLNRSKL